MTYNNRNASHGGGEKKNSGKGLSDDLRAIEKVMPIDERLKAGYVDTAYSVMSRIAEANAKNSKENPMISKTKIRSIYNMLCDIIANESDSESRTLSAESRNALKMFKVHVIYDCGRDDTGSIKRFVIESHIINYLKDIGDSREKFDLYCKYFESLIAYHRFLYKGRE